MSGKLSEERLDIWLIFFLIGNYRLIPHESKQMGWWFLVQWYHLITHIHTVLVWCNLGFINKWNAAQQIYYLLALRLATWKDYSNITEGVTEIDVIFDSFHKYK